MVTLWRVANVMDLNTLNTFTSTTISPAWQTENLNNVVIDFSNNNISASTYHVMFDEPHTDEDDNNHSFEVTEDDNFSMISNSGSRSDDVTSDDVEWESVLFKADIPSPGAAVAVETTGADAADGGGGGGGVCDADDRQLCKVCGGLAAGMYFSARVCVPCKTFFLRYCELNAFACRYNKTCIVSVSTRTQCQFCRYQKCLQVGMIRKVRPTSVDLVDGQLMCVVCGDIGNGLHFGVITCEGCKKFFRRGLLENVTFVCNNYERCVINPRTRNSCRQCRYRKCLEAGMSRCAIQMGRPPKTKATLPVLTVASAVGVPDASVCKDSKKTSRLLPADSSSHHYSPSIRNDEELVPMTSSEVNRKRCRTPTVRNICSNISSEETVSSAFLPNNGIQPDSTEMDIERLPGHEKQSRLDVNVEVMSGTVDETRLTPSWVAETCSSGVLSTEGIDVTFQHLDCLQNLLSSTYNIHHTHSATPMTNLPIFNDVTTIPTTSVMCGAPKRRSLNYSLATVNVNEAQSRNVAVIINKMAVPGDVIVDSALVDSSLTTVTNVVDVGLGSPSVTSSTRRLSLKSHINAAAENVGSDVNITSDAVCRQLHVPNDMVANDVTRNEATARESVKDDTISMMGIFEMSNNYWLCPDLPDDNVLFAGDHWLLIKCIIPSYHRFVNRSKKLNDFLGVEYEKWKRITNDAKQLPKWIENTVIPLYTLSSVKYCQSLPGFTHLALEDQATLIRLGQSSSRILVAAHQWFDAEQHRFRNFLPWRRDYNQSVDDVSTSNDGYSDVTGDLFKQELVSFCDSIQQLQLDSVEAGLLNVLLIFATDLPNLKGVAFIERLRRKIILTFRAYTTAKYGSPNSRLEEIFSFMPSCRRLGLLHYLMTTTTTISMEEVQATHAVDMTLGSAQ